MNPERITIINWTSFLICLTAISAAVVIGALGIWGVIPVLDGALWRALGTCGTVFGGSVVAALAIRCFKTNE